MIVRVPGSSANLGPGFDCFGIAWQCYNTLEFQKAEAFSVTGCPEEFQNRENLAYLGYEAVCRQAGIDPSRVAIRFGETEIPVSRGLGSSAALLVAGAAGANALHRLGLSREELLSIAAPLEGHPDNIAPSLLGGLSVSIMEGGRTISRPFPVSDKLHFTALIPDFRLSTALARSVLPESYSRSDVIFNVSRASLLLRALADGDGELLARAMADAVHQPYRTRLIAGFEQAKALAMEQGALALCISGAGPTLLCVSEQESFAENMQRVLPKTFPGWRCLALQVDREGVSCQEE